MIKRCNAKSENPVYEFEIKNNPNFTEDLPSENRSLPWSVINTINYFNIKNGEEKIVATLSSQEGKVYHQWELNPDENLEVDESLLPDKSSIYLLQIRSMKSSSKRTYKVVVIR